MLQQTFNFVTDYDRYDPLADIVVSSSIAWSLRPSTRRVCAVLRRSRSDRPTTSEEPEGRHEQILALEKKESWSTAVTINPSEHRSMTLPSTILGIDPGTKCGWAVIRDGVHLFSGVWDLQPRRHEGGGMRFVRMLCKLNEIAGATKIDAVAYEEVRRHLGVDAAHIYGGVVATLSGWCEERSIPYEAIPVGTIKKHATGSGNANKESMIDAAKQQWPSVSIIDDNHADALWIAETMRMSLSIV